MRTPPTLFIGQLMNVVASVLIRGFYFVSQGRYSEGQAARIMAEVAEAVGFLHRQGIVHFDLVRACAFVLISVFRDVEIPIADCTYEWEDYVFVAMSTFDQL